MSQEISTFDVMVHPDFHLMYCSNSLDPKQINLRSKYDQRVEGIAKDPSHGLFYLSSWDQTIPETLTEQEDRQRVFRYLRLLSNKLVVFTEHLFPDIFSIERRIAGRSWKISECDLNFYFYGEYSDLCVPAARDHFNRTFNGRIKQSIILEGLTRSQV